MSSSKKLSSKSHNEQAKDEIPIVDHDITKDFFMDDTKVSDTCDMFVPDTFNLTGEQDETEKDLYFKNGFEGSKRTKWEHSTKYVDQISINSTSQLMLSSIFDISTSIIGTIQSLSRKLIADMDEMDYAHIYLDKYFFFDVSGLH